MTPWTTKFSRFGFLYETSDVSDAWMLMWRCGGFCLSYVRESSEGGFDV